MTKALALGSLAVFLTTSSLFLTTSALAEATRPLIHPPMAIKVTKGQMPTLLSTAIEKKTVGLDLENAATKKRALTLAKEYIELRRGGWSKAKMQSWFDACEKDMGARDPNPYCRIEQERQTHSENPASKSVRDERRQIAELIREEKFDALQGREYQNVYSSLSQVGDVEALVPLAKKVAGIKSCKSMPAALPAALGYKLEEKFPDKEIVELAKTLYRRGSECGGKDLAGGTASFRLGLILIWQNQFSEIDALMQKVEASADASQYHPRARYWRYQAAVASKNETAQKTAKDAILSSNPMTFQNLAINGGDEQMMAKVVSKEMPMIWTRSLIRPDLNGILRGAEALERQGSAQLAAEVLDRSITDLATIEPEVRLYTAAFCNRIGYALPKFKILTSLFADAPKFVTASTMELMFPLWYVDLVRSKQQEVDPLLILSLMRQESAFNPQAMSGVGARGLMQVMPATARMIMKVSKNQLLTPDVNVTVGTKYFLKRLNQFGGDVELTLAAYNAGAGRVDQWLKRYPTDNKILFLDFIPFRETREYVSAILRNYYWYTRLYAPETATGATAVALETGKIQTQNSGRVQAILNANAGFAARLITDASGVTSGVASGAVSKTTSGRKPAGSD